MAVEIERKFLVNGKGWRELCKKSERLKDGLLAVTDEGVNVRVRLYEGRATLTVKSRGEGAKNAEFEYDIPISTMRTNSSTATVAVTSSRRRDTTCLIAALRGTSMSMTDCSKA